ncbi:hypothetical protein [Paenibacillus agaridevorans]|uniref:hypothetical protein n=1 Tax=Paenibacillus agaridevorans TaxID=171404 RepID=UPI001FE46EBE|nr:hypothetical protein [Paenibacillus agaridevorans]
MELIPISSLAKLFPDEEHSERPYTRASALINETFAFQVAYRSDFLLQSVFVRIESPLENSITVRRVGLAPSELPLRLHENREGRTLRTTPGLYPDPLLPLKNGVFDIPPRQWRALWVTVDPVVGVSPGLYPIRIVLETAAEVEAGEVSFELIISSLLWTEK